VTGTGAGRLAALLNAGRYGTPVELVRGYIEALEEHAVRLEVERDQRARLAAATERARVPHETHDILGHTPSVIAGRADGAAGLAETRPERGTEALRLIADSGAGPWASPAACSPSSATTRTRTPAGRTPGSHPSRV
jgi:hypothetical protein